MIFMNHFLFIYLCLMVVYFAFQWWLFTFLSCLYRRRPYMYVYRLYAYMYTDDRSTKIWNKKISYSPEAFSASEWLTFEDSFEGALVEPCLFRIFIACFTFKWLWRVLVEPPAHERLFLQWIHWAWEPGLPSISSLRKCSHTPSILNL